MFFQLRTKCSLDYPYFFVGARENFCLLLALHKLKNLIIYFSPTLKSLRENTCSCTKKISCIVSCFVQKKLSTKLLFWTSLNSDPLSSVDSNKIETWIPKSAFVRNSGKTHVVIHKSLSCPLSGLITIYVSNQLGNSSYTWELFKVLTLSWCIFYPVVELRQDVYLHNCVSKQPCVNTVSCTAILSFNLASRLWWISDYYSVLLSDCLLTHTDCVVELCDVQNTLGVFSLFWCSL